MNWETSYEKKVLVFRDTFHIYLLTWFSHFLPHLSRLTSFAYMPPILPDLRSSTGLHTPLCLFRRRDIAARFRIHSLRHPAIPLDTPSSATYVTDSLHHTPRKPSSGSARFQNLFDSRSCPDALCKCCHRCISLSLESTHFQNQILGSKTLCA